MTYTTVSPIANDAAYAAIVQWVNDCAAQYAANNASWNTSYKQDAKYINKVLAKFAQTRNVEQLIEAISKQDTYVRDYYASIVNDLYSTYYNGKWE